MIHSRAFTRDKKGQLKVKEHEWPDTDWPKPQTWLELHQKTNPQASGGYIWMTTAEEDDEVVLFSIPPGD